MTADTSSIADQSAESPCTGALFRVRGLVQGVGFRPTVWRLAHRFAIKGEVLNDGAGVLIRAWGTPEDLSGFERALWDEPPPLARIDAVERAALVGAPPAPHFRIAPSERGSVSTGIVADAATCQACLSEVLDPQNRRYRYPFTNCTHCGPRLSIVRALPYDREATSMAAFAMCPECRAEYECPSDRRFHAEPNACPACGPRVWLEDGSGLEQAPAAGTDAVSVAADLIRSGAIVALKGVGGFHLACDATNAEAVARLRQRKRRYHKPFALMARDIDTIRTYAKVAEGESDLLRGAAAPIVVLERHDSADGLAPALAPGQSTLGFMLPYTPLHHLLMQEFEAPIVLTSGNASDEPQCIENADARHRLRGIADAWLMHDRDIVNRLDDSVVRRLDGVLALIRRARGFAPAPLPLPPGFGAAPRILALGAELKSTFTILNARQLVLSQHIGDLEDATTHDDFRAALRLYRRMFAFDPEVIAVDAHPDYLSTQWGRALAEETGAPVAVVQHHHAHVAAVLAEHGIDHAAPPVLGVVLDGLGYGLNGELWGGEFLWARYNGFERLAAFAPVALVGGNRAMREPWRNAFAHLDRAFGWAAISRTYPDLEITRFIASKQPAVLGRMIADGINAPLASSAGRLFDAAAAILGLHAKSVSYEGQAAIELEAIATPHMALAERGYPVQVETGSPIRLSWRPFWTALLADLAYGVPVAVIAARVHQGVIDAVVQTAARLCRERAISTAVLAGGVFQNRILLEGVAGALRARGVTVLYPGSVPANDGGISLGQAVIAASIHRSLD